MRVFLFRIGVISGIMRIKQKQASFSECFIEGKWEFWEIKLINIILSITILNKKS